MMISGCEKTEAADNGQGADTEPNAASQDDSGAAKYEGEGFASPEEAFRAYIDALKEADFDKAVSTFAIESFVQGYSAQKDLERKTVYYFSNSDLPDMGQLSERYNTAKRYLEVYRTIAVDGLVLAGKTIILDSPYRYSDESSAEETEEIVKLYLSAFPDESDVKLYLSEIQLVGFTADVGDYAEMYTRVLKSIQANCEVYGGEEIKPMIANVTIGGTSYYIAMDTIKYGDSWYLYGPGMSAVMLGLPTTVAGAVSASDLEQF